MICSLLGLTLGCSDRSALSTQQSSGQDDPGAAVVTLTVRAAEERVIAEKLSALGRCEAIPTKQAVIAPLIEGQVAALLVMQGDEVAAGQAVIKLDTTLAKADVAEKEAACDSAEMTLAALKSMPRPEERRSAELTLESSKVALDKARALVERLRPLRERNEIPQSQLFEAEQAAKEADLQQQSAEAQLKLLSLEPRPEIVAEAESKISLAKEALKTAQSRLDLLTLKAPIKGVVTSLTCRPGQTCSVGTPIAEIIDSREVLAVVWLPVARSHFVQTGSPSRVHSAVQPLAGPRSPHAASLAGTVTYVGRNADMQTGNVEIQILVDNKAGKLIVGQTLSADVLIGEPAKMLCVPLDAVRDEGDESAITVIRAGKTVVLHPESGVNDGTWIAVSDTDLKAGEPVAVSGAYNLPDGTLVKTKADVDAPAPTK